MEATNWLRLERTVRFGDTDAAGVIQFHQLLRWCHEAYEAVSYTHLTLPTKRIV